MDAIAGSSKVVKYVDMPLQHIDEEMLRLMRRETSRKHIEDLIQGLREVIPDITLRTTFIVGFPGETEKQFESLLEFIERIRFERLGIFTYSQEGGSRAAKMSDQLSAATKNARYRRAMQLQQKIASEHAKSMIGKQVQALVEQPLVARTAGDAP
jgi:ribosomal protein S12 methylthiotransferase